MALLEVRDLHTYFRAKQGPLKAVNGVSFSVDKGEILGIVGESGSGKTITALSIMRLLPPQAHVDSGEILYQDRNLLIQSKSEMERVRGSHIGIIFQEPDLNPIMTIESQLSEILLHGRGSGKEKKYWIKNPRALHAKLIRLMEDVGIADAEKRLKSYAFELSGGMKQRVMVAMMALAQNPKLLIADEPTTALDVTIQAQILTLLQRIVREKNMSMLLITHNLALVAGYADRVIVMRDGEIVEGGEVYSFFGKPTHPYTQNLLRAVPRLDEYKRVLAPIERDASAVLTVENLSVHFPIYKGIGFMKKRIGSVRAVDGVGFQVREGEILGIVGESGCGKTTLARAILRLIPKDEMERGGSVVLRLGDSQADIYQLSKKELNSLRQNVQVVFQEAQDALNPRRSVGDLVVEGLLIHKKIHPLQRDQKARELFKLVGIDSSTIDRFPSQFSSGQRQRITIARALALKPKVLILDEPVASLDVSVQEEVVDLLLELKDRLGLTYIMISHDVALVKDIAHRIFVMYLGKIVELGVPRDIVGGALHPYTKALLSAVPIPDPVKERARDKIILHGEIPSPANIPSGCRFRTRCPFAQDACVEKEPELLEHELGHFAACHYVREISEGMHHPTNNANAN